MPIQINNLRANGADLFDDSESYMRELSDGDFELSGVNGGTTPLCIASAAGSVTGSELFTDSESFMSELTNRELEIRGGMSNITAPPIWILTLPVL